MPETSESRRDPASKSATTPATPHHRLAARQGANAMPLYRVNPAGKAFYHVVEIATDRVIGYRRRHSDACALAQSLEASE